jgi:hypothetical protein
MYRLLAFLAVFTLVAGASVASPTARRYAVEGLVFDRSDSRPIPHVTVQVEGTLRATVTNEEGRYRLLLEPGNWEIHFSHVAYSSDTVVVSVSDAAVVADLSLVPAPYELPGISVYSRAYDPAQSIIVKAIERKQEILNRFNDYQCDAYTKIVLYDLSKTGVESVFMLAESQTSAFWEQPDKYKEIITARRQSGNIGADENLLRVGEIINFNKNRIDLGKYAVVSPTAKDALDYYDYYLLDTVFIDGRPVFRLEIEPKSDADPLFQGLIDIADSTFDVVAVDVGFNEAVRFAFLDSLRYSQRFARFDREYWMPIDIRFSGQVHFEVPIPTFPKDLAFSQSVALYRYEFNVEHPGGMFDEYIVEVADDADDVDTAVWNRRQTVPLTQLEEDSYRRIDSLEALPPSVGKLALRGLGGAMALMFGAGEDFFHYNRVDGPYAGARINVSPDQSLRTFAKAGYAFERSEWQYGFGLSGRLSERYNLWLGGSFHDQTVKRSTLITPDSFPTTVFALFAAYDPFDYYKEKGFEFWAECRLANQLKLRVTYQDYRQETVPVATDYSFFGGDPDDSIVVDGATVANPDSLSGRDNPAIADGRLRSIGASLTLDSRKLIRTKGRDIQVPSSEYMLATVGVEYAGDDFVDNDFSFWRYYVRLEHRRRLLGFGRTTLTVSLAGSERLLPPQRLFTVDHSIGDVVHTGAFFTMDETNFYGDHAAAVYLFHDFDQLLFRKSGIPGVRDIPFTLSIFGGAFWTEYRNRDGYLPLQPSTGRKPYIEAGFGLGNLTPFMTPLNLGLWFMWQISDFADKYDTNRFSLNWGFSL